MAEQKTIVVTVVTITVTLMLILGVIHMLRSDSSFTNEGLLSGETVSLTGTVTSVDVADTNRVNPGIVVATTDAGEAFITLVPSLDTIGCPARLSIADVMQVRVGDTISVTGTRNNEGTIIPCADQSHAFAVYSLNTQPEYGYEFMYRTGPKGYVLQTETESTHPDFLSGVVLYDHYEYELFTASREAREAPTALRVRAYANKANVSAAVWAMQQPTESNSHLMMGEMSEVVVGGANGVRFVADGLYPSVTYVVAHAGFIYVLSGSYMDINSDIYRDFASLIESFRFIPVEPAQQVGKINPQVACESALIYMTFTDGEAADAFVSECVAGEHPEVIERYIKELGVPGASI